MADATGMSEQRNHTPIKTYIRTARVQAAALAAFCLVAAIGFFGLMGSGQPQPRERPYRLLDKPVFVTGEKLEYRVHYGFITAGHGTLRIADRFQKANNDWCWRVEVNGRSTGAFDRIVRIRNQWGTYIDTSTMKPTRSYRTIEENRYRLKEEVNYDYTRNLALVQRSGSKDTSYRVPNNVQDIVSGYYILRQIDYSALQAGDVVVLDAFFDKLLYKFRVRYVGREVVKTEFGKVRAILLSPIMPKNGLFDGENSIKFWMSDDQNRIPLKVRAEMFVGGVELDLDGYSGIKGPLAIVK